MKRILATAVLGLLLTLCALPLSAAERRPVEATWEVRDSRLVESRGHPTLHYFVVGEQGTMLLHVDPSDLDLFATCDVRYDVPESLEVASDESLRASEPGVVEAFQVWSSQPGRFPIQVKIESPDRAFTLLYRTDLVFVDNAAEIPEPPSEAPAQPPIPSPSSSPPTDTVGRAPAPEPAPNYARVWGLAGTYEVPGEDRRYMLRGVKLELWDTTTLLKTVYASDDMGEGNCGTDMEDYLEVSSNIWYHVSDTGFFDFGDIWVGSGKTLRIREVFEFYAGAGGTSTTGVHRATIRDHDNGDVVIEQWWNLGTVSSEDDRYAGLYSAGIGLSGTNGTPVDEAMHALFDISRMYRYFRDCTGYYTDHTPVHLMLGNTGAPSSTGTDMWMRGWDNGYLNYHHTDSIRHEYTHSMHYRMRGGSFPPWAPGDVNHGGCANSDSADALTEGFARFVPPMIYRDGIYHWTASGTRDMSISSNYCADPTPDDRHEWAVGPALWKSWDNAAGSNAFADCTMTSLATWDEDYVEDVFDDMAADCSYDFELWSGFDYNSIDYDDTQPANPSPIWVSPAGPWTNDNTPTWSWSQPWDDLSQIDGYGIFLTTWTGAPSMDKDIEEVVSYTPAALSDGDTWYLNLRSVDNAGNWSSTFTYGGPIGIDTVLPGLVSGLASSSHTVGSWSNNPSLLMNWTAATDDRSGLDGYGLYTTTSASIPGAFKDIEEVTTYTESLSSSANGWYFNVRSVDHATNWDDGYASAGPYYVDTVLPGAPTSLLSTSHVLGAWSNDTTIDFSWSPAADSHSGIDGYGICWTTGLCSPALIKDIEEVTSLTQTASTSTSGYYLNLRSVDHATNWQTDYTWAGPYYVDAVVPTAASGFYSPTHALNKCTTDQPFFSIEWTPAADAHAGLTGYSYAVSTSSPKNPDSILDLDPSAIAFSGNLSYSAADRYFNLLAADAAGNWSALAYYGPFTVDRTPEPSSDVEVTQPDPDPEIMKLTWSAGSGSLSFQVDRSLSPEFTFYDKFAVAGKEFTDTAPPIATVVYYRVRGVNSCGAVGP